MCISNQCRNTVCCRRGDPGADFEHFSESLLVDLWTDLIYGAAFGVEPVVAIQADYLQLDVLGPLTTVATEPDGCLWTKVHW